MSELFDGYDGDEDELEIDEDELELDAAAVAHLDQEQAAWEEHRQEFLHLYGFDHNCRCSQDYTEGNLKTVTECFMGLTGQAMARSAEATQELRLMGALMDQLLTLNNDLVDMLRKLGHEDELEAYFTQEVELDEDVEGLFEEPEDAESE